MFCCTAGLRRWDYFWGNIPKFAEQITSRQLWTTVSGIFDIFSLNFSMTHFSCSKPFPLTCPMLENNILNKWILLKTNLCGINFPNFKNFDWFGENQHLRNFPVRVHFRGNFAVEFGKSLWGVFVFVFNLFPKTVVFI